MNGTSSGGAAAVQPQTSTARQPDMDAIKMFVGQIPRSWGEDECLELFEKYGPVYQLNVLRDKTTQASRGCCFVTFYKRADAIAAQAALHNIQVLPGMHHPVQMKPADSENRNERKLFVGMLNKKLTEDDVRGMFKEFGHIEDCTVLKDVEGKSRGCAFVTFVNRSCAQQAIKQMHHTQTMEGCSTPIVVKFADTQKEKDAKKAGTPSSPALQTSMTLSNSIQQLLQNAQPCLNLTNPAAPIAALAALLQGAAQHNAAFNLLGSAQQQQQLPGVQQQSTGAATSPSESKANILLNNTGSNLIQLTGAAASPGIEALQQAYAGMQQYAAAFPQLAAAASQPLLVGSTGSNGTVAAAAGNAVANSGGQSKGPDGCNLFIYHLPQDFTDNDLITTFSPFGTILSAKVFIDKQTNLSKCFGFVSYDNAVAAQNAISALNGFQIGSKRLKVQLKRGKECKPYMRNGTSITSSTAALST
uniref:CUGBP Elav-like family member 2 n=1 Tax=Syphacia muris TaxID=451379 RepID=A0A0N5AL45_9BILA